MKVENDVVSDLTQSTKIIGDGWFKAAAKYKIIAAILMKYTIEEYKDMDILDVAKLIVDRRKKNSTGYDILGDEIDLDPSESGDKDDKGIRHDIVFTAKSLKSTKRLLNKITINFEVQSSKKPYNMVSRAVYYTSHLLKNTIHKGDDYNRIHKVYSIWFCDFTLEDEIVMYEEIKDRAVHHYRMCRHYSDLGKVSVDAVGDLMEAVMVELPKTNKEESKLIYKLFYDTANSIDTIEETTKINLSKYKEVESMFNVAEEIKASEDRGKAYGKEIGMLAATLQAGKNLVESLKKLHPEKSYDSLIDESASLLKLDDSIVGQLRKMF